MSEDAYVGHLLAAGVKNLRDFGYPKCDGGNITTTPIYAAFFKSMLEETKEHAPLSIRQSCDVLLRRIEAAKPKDVKPAAKKKPAKRKARKAR